MALEFTKPNLLMILITIEIKKNDGIFIQDIIAFANKNAKEPDNIKKTSQISKATLYNYMSEIRELLRKQDSLLELDQTTDIEITANYFVKTFPRQADKYYRKFSEKLYRGFETFLEKNEYIPRTNSWHDVIKIEDHFHHSMLSFAGASDDEQSRLRDRILGQSTTVYFRVYRESLQNPEKYILSCARMFEGENRSLKYQEIMHFKNPTHGDWRRQIFNGYIIRKNGYMFLYTRDSNSDFIQSTFLDVKYQSAHDNVINELYGTYNGISRTLAHKFYSCGIFFHRIPKPEYFGEDEFETWNIGEIDQFGLFTREEAQINDHLFNFLFRFVPITQL